MKILAIFEGGLSIWHVLIVLGIALLLFGTKKLPDIGKSLGKGIKEFKTGIQGMGDDVREGMGETPKAQSESVDPKANKAE